MDWLLSPSTCMIKNDCRNFYIVNLSLNIDTWFQVPLYLMPLSNPLPWQTREFSINPPSKSWTFKIPPLQTFSGDLEVSSKISVSWEKSNFNTNLWNDRVQCISTKWCKKEHVLYIYLYTAICWIYMYMSNTRFSYNYMLNIRFTCVAKWIVYFCYLV